MASCSGNGARGHHKFTLNVNESYVSNGIDNYSSLKWNLVLSPIQVGWDWYYNSAPVGFNVIVNGTKVASGGIANYDGSSTITVASGTLKVPHNDDGTKKVSFSFEVWDNVSASYLPGSAKGSGSITLTTIPRYANSEIELTDITETSVKVNWSSDQTIDKLSYSTNDGYSYTELESAGGTGGSFTINTLTANTLYNIKIKVRREDNQLESESPRAQVTTYDYPYCIDTPNFIIGEELTLTLYNPLRRLVLVTFIGANGESLATDETSMATASGYNTDTFKNKLYESIPNSNSGTYKIKVTYESNERIRDNGNTYTVNINECKPLFSDFDYKDINTLVTSITGNDKALVKGFSNIQVIVDSNNKMVAQKGASSNKYIAVIDTLNANANHSSEDVVLNLGTIINSGTKRLTVTAYDSRNNSTAVYKDIVVYDYTKPVVNVQVARLNNFEKQTTLSVNGTYNRLTIDNVDKNSIVSVQYRYREKGGEWTDWTNINTTLSSGKFTCNDVILSLDISKEFDIEVKATDKLDSGSESGSVGIGESIFFISSNKKACYINNQKIIMYDVVEEW